MEKLILSTTLVVVFIFFANTTFANRADCTSANCDTVFYQTGEINVLSYDSSSYRVKRYLFKSGRKQGYGFVNKYNNNEKQTFLHPNGAIHTILKYKNGLRDGKAIYFDQYGYLDEIEHCKNGDCIKHKISDDDTIAVQRTINDNLQFKEVRCKEGLISSYVYPDSCGYDYKTFYCSGEVEVEATRCYNEFIGEYKQYYKNGNLMIKCYYAKKRIASKVIISPTGVYTFYNKDGTVQFLTDYGSM